MIDTAASYSPSVEPAELIHHNVVEHHVRHLSSWPFFTLPNRLLNIPANSTEILDLFSAAYLPAATTSPSDPTGGQEWRLQIPEFCATPSDVLG